MKTSSNFTKGTQNGNIIRHLKNVGSITPLTALGMYGVFRLAARILELRECYEIKTTNKYDFTGKQYAEYSYIGPR